MQSDLSRYQQSIEVVPRQQDLPLVVDFTESVDKFYKCFVEFDNEPDTSKFVDICLPFVLLGMFYRTRWWIVGRSTINGEEISVFKLSTKNELFRSVTWSDSSVQRTAGIYDHCRKSDTISEHTVNTASMSIPYRTEYWSHCNPHVIYNHMSWKRRFKKLHILLSGPMVSCNQW
jgi:hypothetical protein